MSREWSQAGPESMRDRLAAYVHALHRAYLSAAEHLSPGERAALPLLGADGEVTVVVAAARDLHVLATTDPLPAPRGVEVEIVEDLPGLSWRVRFFDPSILPGLGMQALGDGEAAGVRSTLGVASVLYHLSVSPGGGLSEHHAQHAGVALANQHAAAARDGAALRAAWPGREQVVEEFLVCERLGLARAADLLAADLAGPALRDTDRRGDLEALRKTLLRIGRTGS